MACINNRCDVLVRLRGFLHHQFGRGHSDGDALFCQLVQHLLVAQVTATLASVGEIRTCISSVTILIKIIDWQIKLVRKVNNKAMKYIFVKKVISLL